MVLASSVQREIVGKQGLMSKTTEAVLTKTVEWQAANATLPIKELLQHRKINSGSFAKKSCRWTYLPEKTLADHDIFGRQPLHRKKSNDSEDNILFRNNWLLNQLPMIIFQNNNRWTSVQLLQPRKTWRLLKTLVSVVVDFVFVLVCCISICNIVSYLSYYFLSCITECLGI